MRREYDYGNMGRCATSWRASNIISSLLYVPWYAACDRSVDRYVGDIMQVAPGNVEVCVPASRQDSNLFWKSLRLTH